MAAAEASLITEILLTSLGLTWLRSLSTPSTRTRGLVAFTEVVPRTLIDGDLFGRPEPVVMLSPGVVP